MDFFELLKSINNFWNRQWKFIVSFLLSGVLLGIVYDQIKTPYYESTATVTSGLSYFEGIIDPSELDYPIIDQKIAIDMVNAIGAIVKSGEYEILAKTLNVSGEVAQTIKMIEAEQLYELDLENRRQKLSQFKVTIRVLNNQSIKVFQEGIHGLFNNNAYSNKNYSLFKRQAPILVSYLEQEIIDLRDYRNQIKNKSDVELSSISIANDKSELLQNQIIQLFERKQSIERDLELLNPISFVSEFPVYKNPKNRKLVRVGILGVFFLFIGFFLALFREVRNAVEA
jgi:hypothetical protein